MKKLLVIFFALISFQLSTNAQTVTYENTTAQYFIGSFLVAPATCAAPGAPVEYFIDIPNNYTYTTYNIWDDQGNPTTLTNIVGIGLQVYPGGPSFQVGFCTPIGTRTLFVAGFGLVTVDWRFNGGSLHIRIR